MRKLDVNAVQRFGNALYGSMRALFVDKRLMFVGVDIGKVLQFKYPTNAIYKYCDPKGVVYRRVPDEKGTCRGCNLISLDNVSKLINESPRKDANEFKNWLSAAIDNCLAAFSDILAGNVVAEIEATSSATAKNLHDEDESVTDSMQDGEQRAQSLNGLSVFSQDVIPVYTTSTGEKIVLGRELHAKLGITTRYNDWFPRMVEYGFIEGEDFYSFLSKSQNNGRPSASHILKLDMAKHIAMIQRTPQGKAIRDKLIQLETDVSALSPELQCMIHLELEQKKQAKALKATNQRIDDIQEIVILNPNSWRKETAALIRKIAWRQDSDNINLQIKFVTANAYKLLEARAGVNLLTRLNNKKGRMRTAGAKRADICNLNRLDIIAEDKKLVEIYIAVVKEMAIKEGISVNSPAPQVNSDK